MNTKQPFTIVHLNLVRGTLGCHHFDLLYLALCCSGTKPKVVTKKPAQLCWVHTKLCKCGTVEYGLMRQVYTQAAARGEGSNWNKNPVWPPNFKSPFRSYPFIGEIKKVVILPEEANLQGGKIQKEALDIGKRKAMVHRVTYSCYKSTFAWSQVLMNSVPRQQSNQGNLFSYLLLSEFQLPFSTAHQKKFFHVSIELHKPSDLVIIQQNTDWARQFWGVGIPGFTWNEKSTDHCSSFSIFCLFILFHPCTQITGVFLGFSPCEREKIWLSVWMS